MTGRWGLGPVFAAEWLTTSRRWQVYAGRAAFVGILLVALTTVWAAQVWGRTFATIHDMAAVGQSFYGSIVFTQMTLVILAAPAATAGVVCQDKGRGNLALLLLTDLSDAEIVLGKLASRLVPVLGMVGCALPVLALGTLLGGIDPGALAGVLAITLGLAVFGCSLALAFSIWGTKPYEVLLATFAVFTVWMLAVPVWEFFEWLWRVPAPPDWVLATNPYILALAPYLRPGQLGVWYFVGFVGGILILSASLVVISVVRMRLVVVDQADRPLGFRGRRVGARPRLVGVRIGLAPALEDDPVLWYEWHRARPSPWIWSLMGLYVVLALAFTALALVDTLSMGSPMRGWFPGYVVAFEATMGLPLLLVSATTALVEERARGSLDVLLTTPLSSRNVVLAKWWGVFRQVGLLVPLPAVLAAALSWGKDDWTVASLLVLFLLTSGALWTSVGLAISTWVPRLGRAVALAVVLYALIGLGWPMVAMTLFNPGGPGTGLAAVSPFYGLFDLTVGIEHPYYFPRVVVWSLGWIVVQAVLAGGLLLATLATFDRSLGRIPERARGGRRSRSGDSPAGEPPGDPAADAPIGRGRNVRSRSPVPGP